MKLYVLHASSYDYQTELYEPLKQAFGEQHDITLPHSSSGNDKHSKETIQESDLVVADISYPSLGEGIEMGWAEAYGTPIVCIYREGSTPSATVRHICDSLLEYSDTDDMICKLREFFDAFNA